MLLQKISVFPFIFFLAVYSDLHTPVKAQASVYILLFDAYTDNEGVHSLFTRLDNNHNHPSQTRTNNGTNTVLMFSSYKDASEYAAQLVKLAKDRDQTNYKKLSVEPIHTNEILRICKNERYNCKSIPEGSKLAPPADFVDNTDWQPLIKIINPQHR